MNKEMAPTYEDFYSVVKAIFKKSWKKLDDNEVERYFSEDGRIKTAYDKYLELYGNNEVTYEQFMDGHAATIAYQLIMEY